MIASISIVSVIREGHRRVKFYTDILGFEEKDDITLGDGYRWCTVVHPSQPELAVSLAVPGPPFSAKTSRAMTRAQADGGLNGLGLDVDDCQRTYRETSAKGVEFLSHRHSGRMAPRPCVPGQLGQLDGSRPAFRNAFHRSGFRLIRSRTPTRFPWAGRAVRLSATARLAYLIVVPERLVEPASHRVVGVHPERADAVSSTAGDVKAADDVAPSPCPRRRGVDGVTEDSVRACPGRPHAATAASRPSPSLDGEPSRRAQARCRPSASARRGRPSSPRPVQRRRSADPVVARRPPPAGWCGTTPSRPPLTRNRSCSRASRCWGRLTPTTGPCR